jgi:uncharacterized protein (UPF0332 family)
MRALESAAALLDKGDVEGSANRAYYAMFHAAGVRWRAATLRSEAASTERLSDISAVI